MSKLFIKGYLVLSLFLMSSSAQPLSEQSAHVIAAGSGIGSGLTSALVTGLILNAAGLDSVLGKNGTLTLVATAGLSTGIFTWWAFEKILKKFTPECRYILVQDLMQVLEHDLKDKKNRASIKTLAMVREIKTIVKDIARDTMYDASAKKLHVTCKDILGKLTELEIKIELKIDYNSIISILDSVQSDSLISRDFNPVSLLAFVQMRFGTNWPLVEARNSLKDLFGRITQAQRYANKILSHANSSKKLKDRVVQAGEIALVLTIKLEQCMNSILEHPEYAAQKALHEVDRARKNDQAAYTQAMEKEREHQRELERARQRHEREMKERELLEKQREQKRRERQKEKERELKKDIIEHAAHAEVHAEVKF